MRRPHPWQVWAVAGLCVLGLVFSAVLGLTTDPSLHVEAFTSADIGWWVTCLVFLVVGALVSSRRPENPVGWLMLATGVANAAAQVAPEYAVWGLVRHPGSVPGAAVAAWATEFLWVPSIALVVVTVAYFPTGALASRHWRWLPWAVGLVTATISLVAAVDLWPLRGRRMLQTNVDFAEGRVSSAAVTYLYPLVLLCALAAMASVVVRYRRSKGIERQQLKWLALAAVVSVPPIVVDQVAAPSSTVEHVSQVLNSPVWFAIAAALAILRYRLYDIDRIVSRTVSYAVVTGLLVGVYVGCVAVTTGLLPLSSAFGVAASTLVAAALFQPLRRRVQSAVDRRFNRARYDAVRTVEAFAVRLRDEVDADVVRGDLLTAVQRALEPASASLWQRGGAAL